MIKENLEQLTQEYLLIQRCWHNYDMAIKENMSVTRAVHTLTDIISATNIPARAHLNKLADVLLQEIIHKQADPAEINLKPEPSQI